MKILAIEFSSAQRSIAVLSDVNGQQQIQEAVESGPTTSAFGLTESVLEQTGVDREQIELVVIGLGPGSYTGIRAAIAVGYGWQLSGTGAHLTGISSAEAIAAEAAGLGFTGKLHVVIDAQRRELYWATYELDPSGVAKEVRPLRIATMAEAELERQAGGLVVGPEARKWFADAHEVHPRAATLARLAAARWRITGGIPSAPSLEPIYLRETSFVKAPKPRVIPNL